MTVTTTDTPEAEALRVAIDRQMLDYRTATPCIVTAVSANGTTVDVQPAIPMTRRVDGVQSIRLSQVSGVPIHMFGSTSKGLFVVPPISAGDDGWLVVSDRALDNWQFGEGVNNAPDAETPRHHDLTDAFFLPGAQRASGAIESVPTDAIQLRNRSGTCILSVSDTAIKGTTPSGAMIDLEAGESKLIGAGGSISAGPAGVAIVGALTINGAPFLGHKHKDVQTGTSNSGEVAP